MEQKTKHRELDAICEQLDRASNSLHELGKLIKETQGQYRDLHAYALERRTLREQKEMYAFIEALSEGLRLFDKHEDEKLSGIVYSVVPLESDVIHRMEEQTSHLLKKNCELINQVDEKILGGFIISIDGKLIDASIRKRMEDMRLHLTDDTISG
ncbi:MAG: F0F1 ATP synthase subunit delta [Eubacterium sp.]|nr:F0F1 ATP synthase subunit delta [Eubacterium sp.]